MEQRRSRPGRFFFFAGLGGGLWWLLTDGAGESWPVGLPSAVLFALLAQRSFPGRFAISARGLVRFVPYFLVQSFRGGSDVARRALAPRLALRPGHLSYPLRLPPGAPRMLFVNTISLLPGTLSWSLEDRSVRVHLLHQAAAAVEELTVLEERIAGLFGLSLPEDGP